MRYPTHALQATLGIGSIQSMRCKQNQKCQRGEKLILDAHGAWNPMGFKANSKFHDF